MYIGGDSLGNYSYDIFALTISSIYTNMSSYASYAPAPVNTVGNISSYIGWQALWPGHAGGP
jgi:hypothetical protein